MKATQKEKVLKLVKEHGILRPRDLNAHGLPRETLRRMENRGLLQRIGRGMYMLAEGADITEHHSLAQACKRVPRGVICLLSALSFHDLTTQLPHQVWMAIGEKARRPKTDGLKMRFVRFSRAALSEGVEEYTIEGVIVRVFNPAKTVVDCFKYRNKIGLDVAIEALKECLRERHCTFDELWRFGKICRVANVMRPYLETMA